MILHLIGLDLDRTAWCVTVNVGESRISVRKIRNHKSLRTAQGEGE